MTLRLAALERLMMVLVGPDANNLASESLLSQELIAPSAQRMLALENRTDTQANHLAKIIGHTESAVETEMAKAETVMDGEMH